MILACNQEVVRILYLKNVLEFTLLVFDLDFVVYFDRSNVIEFDWES